MTNETLPDNKECITIQVIALNTSVTILKYDLHEPLESAVYDRGINFRMPVHRSFREIQLVHPCDVVLLSKL